MSVLEYTPLGMYARGVSSIGKKRAKKLSKPDYSSIYADAHEQLKGTRQDSLVDSISVADYKPSTMDYFELALTGNKSRRWLNAEMQNEQYLRDRMAELASTMSEEERNSPAVQSALMRSAGLNPDLLGISDSSGQASEMSEPDVMQSGAGGLSEGPNLVSQFANIAGSVMSLVSGLQQIRSVQLQNRNQEVKNLIDIAGAGDAFFEAGLGDIPIEVLMENPDTMEENWVKAPSGVDINDILTDKKRFPYAKEVRYGRPNLVLPDIKFRNAKDKRAFESYVYSKYQSMSGNAEWWQQYAATLKNRRDALTERGFSKFSDDSGKYSSALGNLADLAFENEKSFFEFQSKMNAFNAKVTEHLSADDAAGAENAKNQMIRYASEYESQFNKMFSDRAKEIRKKYKNDSFGYFAEMLGLAQSYQIYHDNIAKTLAQFGIEAFSAKSGRISAENSGQKMHSKTFYDANGNILGGTSYDYH